MVIRCSNEECSSRLLVTRREPRFNVTQWSDLQIAVDENMEAVPDLNLKLIEPVLFECAWCAAKAEEVEEVGVKGDLALDGARRAAEVYRRNGVVVRIIRCKHKSSYLMLYRDPGDGLDSAREEARVECGVRGINYIRGYRGIW